MSGFPGSGLEVPPIERQRHGIEQVEERVHEARHQARRPPAGGAGPSGFGLAVGQGDEVEADVSELKGVPDLFDGRDCAAERRAFSPDKAQRRANPAVGVVGARAVSGDIQIPVS